MLLCCCVPGPSGGASKRGQVDFSPAFTWLLRDFQLRLERDGHQISPSEYLEEALQPVQGGEADMANRNQVWPARLRPAVTSDMSLTGVIQRTQLCRCGQWHA